MTTPITDFEVVNNESLVGYETTPEDIEINKSFEPLMAESISQIDAGENAFNNANGNS